MLDPKRIPAEAIGAALEKALRYRLLNEPQVAESICNDVLAADEANQEALITLLLAITDQFDRESVSALERARGVLQRLTSEYDRAYYEGIVLERWAGAKAAGQVPGHVVCGWYHEAMRCYDRAEQLAAPDNADPILRWNTCARMLNRYEEHQPGREEMTRDLEAEFGDEVPAP